MSINGAWDLLANADRVLGGDGPGDAKVRLLKVYEEDLYLLGWEIPEGSELRAEWEAIDAAMTAKPKPSSEERSSFAVTRRGHDRGRGAGGDREDPPPAEQGSGGWGTVSVTT